MKYMVSHFRMSPKSGCSVSAVIRVIICLSLIIENLAVSKSGPRLGRLQESESGGVVPAIEENLTEDVGVGEESPIIGIQLGKIKGLVLQSRKGRKYFGFLGVRYARKPDRFEVAKHPPIWEGVQDASRYGPACAQYNVPTQKIIGEEDCLFLNVYTPQLAGRLKFPVMVFIHGGAFMFGSADGYGEQYFMDEDVILVTINYRLGALGFLSTEDNIIPGNLGLKDQVLALQWVKHNILFFGGDPKRVTIFGESAGAASVNYHMLSPLSVGLFKNAIMQSGSVLCPWAFQREAKANAKRMGKYLDCQTHRSYELKTCLKSKPAKDLIEAESRFKKWFNDPIAPFGPSVETLTVNNTNDVFLSDTPFRLLFQGKVNKNIHSIIGLNEDEGILLHAGGILNNEAMLEALNKHRNITYPMTFNYDNTVWKNEWTWVSDQIHKFYFGNRVIGENTKQDLTNLYSDRYFNHGVITAAILYIKHGAGNVFPYIFGVKGGFTFAELYGAAPGYHGVTHLDDLPYFFNITWGETHVPEFEDNSALQILSEQLVRLWVSFAATGKPTKTWGTETIWIPTSAADLKEGVIQTWYKFDTDTSTLFEDPFKSRMKFWDDLPLKELTREKRYKSRRDEL